MAETIGSLIDKILISELKIFHTQLQIERKDVDSSHRDLCSRRIQILKEQRDDLKEEVNHLLTAVIRGEVQLKIYRQFKMYNDPRFKIQKK